MRAPQHLVQRALLVCAPLALLGGCDPYDAYCAKVEYCAEENEDGFENIDTDDDYRAVCTAQMRSPERVLRANEEQVCQVVADAYRAWVACLASLDCDDLNDEMRSPDKCEDERDDYQDALDDADNDCETSVNCASTPFASAPLFAALALLLRLLRRRR